MELLKRRIEKDGVVLSESVLKVDSFLNHCIDPDLMDAMGKEFADAFAGEGVTKVLTIESGGIAPALCAARYLHVPLVFAKKTEPSTMMEPVQTKVHSFTKNRDYTICVEKNTIVPGDRVLFIDDFMANGQAYLGILDLLEQRDAALAGTGICIEKAWQNGSEILRRDGHPFCILASIARMSKEDGIVWNEEADS